MVNRIGNHFSRIEPPSQLNSNNGKSTRNAITVEFNMLASRKVDFQKLTDEFKSRFWILPLDMKCEKKSQEGIIGDFKLTFTVPANDTSPDFLSLEDAMQSICGEEVYVKSYSVEYDESISGAVAEMPGEPVELYNSKNNTSIIDPEKLIATLDNGLEPIADSGLSLEMILHRQALNNPPFLLNLLNKKKPPDNLLN